jgi:hypothetical protein
VALNTRNQIKSYHDGPNVMTIAGELKVDSCGVYINM